MTNARTAAVLLGGGLAAIGVGGLIWRLVRPPTPDSQQPKEKPPYGYIPGWSENLPPGSYYA